MFYIKCNIKKYKVNWNILVAFGKEITRDSVSSGERTRTREIEHYLLNKVTKILWKKKPKKVKALYGNTLNMLFDNAINLLKDRLKAVK